MDVLTKLILIVSGITAVGGVGYLCRKGQLVTERSAGVLMYRVVMYLWTPLSMLVLWQLELQWSLIALPMISAVLPIAMAPFGLSLARLHRLERKSAGTFIVACGIGNIGVTMGGFVCYCLFGVEGLGYAQLYTITWTLMCIGIYGPIGRYYGQATSTFNLAFVARTLWDRRSLPLAGSILGLSLSALGVHRPAFIDGFRIIDILVIVSVLLSFFCMGLQMHFTSIKEKPSLQFSLALARFICSPAITAALLVLTGMMFADLPQTAVKVVLIEGIVPTGVFTVVISNLYHLNTRLAGVLFLINTAVFLLIVLPILVTVLG